jgi:hypothetical protein
MNEHWKIARGTLYDKPIRINFYDSVEEYKNSGSFSSCIQIAWHLEDDELGEDGLPKEVVQIKLDDFHYKLINAFETNECAHVVMVICSGNVNQWVLYTSDIETATLALNGIPASSDGYPIEVVADNDPDWSTYHEMYDAMLG